MSCQVVVLLAATLIAAPIPQGGAVPAVLLSDTNPEKKPGDNLSFLQSQAKRLQSNQILEVALRKPGVAGLLPLGLKQNPVVWLQERLRVEVQLQRRTLRVWLEAPGISRRNQAALLNSVVDAYLEELTREHREPIEREIKYLEEFHELERAQLRAARAVARVAPDARSQERVENLQRRIEEYDRVIERLRAQLRHPPRITLLEKARLEP